MENRQAEGKNSVGNVEAKELIRMTHGHELRGDGGNAPGGRRGAERREIKGKKNKNKWNNCNSITIKIHIF